MIYLFGSGSWKTDRKAVKIGYTSDLDGRKRTYTLHNPMGELLDFREGDEKLEVKLHLRLIDYKVEFLEEWFYPEPDVFNIFKEPEESIDKWIWDNRGDTLLYPSIPLPGTKKRLILDELLKKYGNKKNTIDGTKFL